MDQIIESLEEGTLCPFLIQYNAERITYVENQNFWIGINNEEKKKRRNK